MRHTRSIRRRTFCKAAAATLMLPKLEAFADAGSGEPAQRFVALFFPNGVYPDAWQVERHGDGLRFGGSLKPLTPLSEKATVITGLDNPLGSHLGQTSGFLSGHDFKPNENGIVTARTSLDQMLAKRFAGDTFLPSLSLAMEPPSQGGFGNRPKSFGNSISWSSPTNKIEPHVNPQQAFDEVFFGQTEAGRDAARRRETIVNEIWQQSTALKHKISHQDRHRLDQFLDSIHDVQSKLNKTIHRRENAFDADELFRPKSSAEPASYAEHMRLMMDIMLIALQTDSTRVSTLVMGHSVSRIVYDFAHQSIKRNHHDLSHHRNDPEKIKGYNIITQWFAKQAAYFLKRMSEIEDARGSLLDNSVVLYGSGMKDGNVHEPKNVPIALFGGAAGKLRGGCLIECPDESNLTQLHLSLLHLFGVEADDFNGVTSNPISLT